MCIAHNHTFDNLIAYVFSPLKPVAIANSTKFIDIDIQEGGIDDAENWHQAVQPHIASAARLDADWDWPAIYRHSALLEAPHKRKVNLQCMYVANKDGLAVPLAIMLLSEGYPSLDGTADGSVFLWYLASAPSAALADMGVTYQKPTLLVPALVDRAIQLSYELGYDGRVGLHAAAPGGDELFCLYRDGVRMTVLQGNAKLSLGRRLLSGQDGRYFWSDPKCSQSLANSLDYLR